jgi:4a-hydroxytetrahydrobiopterin dehydratase
MTSNLKKNQTPTLGRRALKATEIVSNLARLEGWKLTGDGADVAIEKAWCFADYFETMAFVNAVAFIAHRQDHHPELLVQHSRCVVRFNTHDVGGLTATDFHCASLVDALLAEAAS